MKLDVERRTPQIINLQTSYKRLDEIEEVSDAKGKDNQDSHISPDSFASLKQKVDQIENSSTNNS